MHERVKEASCLAVSNFGEIVMGTSDGNMYVYESLEQLKYKNIIIKGSFITGPSINQRVEKNVATL